MLLFLFIIIFYAFNITDTFVHIFFACGITYTAKFVLLSRYCMGYLQENLYRIWGL